MADNENDLMEIEHAGEIHLPSNMPILPISEAVIFPAMMVPLVLSDTNLVRLADDCLAGDKILGAFAQRDIGSEDEEKIELWRLWIFENEPRARFANSDDEPDRH